MKRFIILYILVIVSSACSKSNLDGQGCAAKVCTQEFASITINFVNNADQPQNVNSFSAINQRTGLEVERSPSPLSSLHTFVIADDSKLSQFSTKGDNVLITGKTSNQTKTAVVNISGGCNCHVERKSGPQTIKFD
ncbi:hypothetical protein GCM10027049_17730 [Mucilaginibacter puniceus]